MQVSRILTVALIGLLAVACDGRRADDDEASRNPLPLATTGQTQDPQPAPATPAKPAAEPEQQPTSPKTAVGEHKAPAGVNADAAVLQDFKDRVAAYMKVRKQAVKDAPPLKETSDPAKIKAAQDGMAAAIRAARPNAKHGDIFTPEITAKFRRLLYPELKGDDGRDAKEILKDDAPAPESIPFKVNAKYPDGAPVPTVPANLLINLPTLPEPLQYRIIGKHVILLDEDADVIVDYAVNVIR